jgi:hypothetical protein
MKIDEYKLMLEVSSLDKTIELFDLSTKIRSIDLVDLEEYRIRYNGEELCSGTFYSPKLISITFDGDVYEIDCKDNTTFLDIIEEVLSVVNLNLFNIEMQSKRFSKYKNVCNTLLDGAKVPAQDQHSHE